VGTAQGVDPRNVFGGSRTAAFRVFVLAILAAGLSVLVLLVGRLDWRSFGHPAPALWVVFLLVLVGELRPLFTAGATDENGLLVTNAFLFAVLLRYGVEVTVLLQAVVTTIVDVSRRKALWRAVFNVSQYTLAWSAAGGLVALLGTRGTLATPNGLHAADLAGALAGGLAYFVINQLLVSRAVSLKVDAPWIALVRRDLAYESVTNGALLALSPLIAVAMERGVAFVPLLLPPLYAVYQVAAVALAREAEAHCDVLTGMPNRKLLVERTEQALREQGEGRVALALFDLDRFKEVNDTLGHHVGDQLLKVVAARLTAAAREGDLVARLGGDEFAMLLPGVRDLPAARETARRMVEVISEPIVLEGMFVEIGASVGVAVSPDHGTGLDTLLQRADVAMYVAKGAGGGVEVYDLARDRNSTSRLALIGELRRAIMGDELVLHYQPKVDLADGRVVGLEALVRWQHPERGLLGPDEFIPMAERSEIIQPLTSWVLDQALAQLARWRSQGLALGMAVNVSARDLCGDDLAARVAALLVSHDLTPGLLQLEVTEGSLLSDPPRALATLVELQELGVPLSLDDFGTGYSSVGHLRQFPVAEIKIDRTFVKDIDTAERDFAIVRGIIDLAVGLGIRVVAEGVETEQVWDRLVELGCHRAQGWFLHRAAPAEEMTPWLLAHAEGVAVAARAAG
jgi:diguanylate cyclase (GGDEF)-like protein